MAMAVNHTGLVSNFVFRTEMGYSDMIEKRQLFLRSYQFSRKKSMSERIKGSFFRVKRVICARLKSARRLRKAVWLRLRYGLFYNTRRRKFFLRLHNSNHYYNYYYNHGSSGLSCPSSSSSSSSSCFW